MRRPDVDQRLLGFWRGVGMESRIHEVLRYEGDDRIVVAILRCFRRALSKMPHGFADDFLEDRTQLILYRLAAEGRASVWVQCEAMSILWLFSNDNISQLFQSRIDRASHPGIASDDLFVRRHLFKLLSRDISTGRWNKIRLPSPEEEPSEFVRQMVATAAYESDSPSSNALFRRLALEDPVPQVRGAALLAGVTDEDVYRTIEHLEVVAESLAKESEPFVLRVGCYVVKQIAHHWLLGSSTAQESCEKSPNTKIISEFYRQRLIRVLRDIRNRHQTIAARRWAAQTMEYVWATDDPNVAMVLSWLKKEVKQIRPGRSWTFSKSKLGNLSDNKIGRLIAVLSQDDFGLDVDKGLFRVRITRGPVWGMRLWRVLHELRHPATDKRQALRHTVGRIHCSCLRAPSQILGELSETKIPGEPLTISTEGSWRPFLPLPDDFVSALNLSWFRRRTVRIFTSEGVTEVGGTTFAFALPQSGLVFEPPFQMLRRLAKLGRRFLCALDLCAIHEGARF